MSRINLYGQNRHLMIVDGIPLTGFADGDYMEIKKDGNAASRTHGGDGPSMNLSTDQGGTISVTLLPTSPAMGPLYSLREAQRSNPRYMSVQLVTGVEEIVSAAGCAFGELPAFRTGGPTMQGRQFTFECLQIDMDLSSTLPAAGGLLGGLL